VETCKDWELPDGRKWHANGKPNYDCEWFGQQAELRCASYGDMYRFEEKTAKQACCACGGGDRPKVLNINGDPRTQLERKTIKIMHKESQLFWDIVNYSDVRLSKKAPDTYMGQWDLENFGSQTRIRNFGAFKNLDIGRDGTVVLSNEEDTYFTLEYDGTTGLTKIKRDGLYVNKEGDKLVLKSSEDYFVFSVL